MKSVAYIRKWTRVNGQNTCLEYFNMECTLVLILPDYSITQILMICDDNLCEINIVCIVYIVMTIYLNNMQLMSFFEGTRLLSIDDWCGNNCISNYVVKLACFCLKYSWVWIKRNVYVVQWSCYYFFLDRG